MNGEFAVAMHALVYLNHKGTFLSSEELADNVCTNSARVRKVMAKLKKAGLVETREGHAGGYSFGLDPAAVSLENILEAVGGAVVSAAWHSGSQDMDCLVASGMGRVLDGLCGELDGLCRQRLAATTVRDIDEMIFGKRGSAVREGDLK